mmetsp:Transcript_53056/g.154388  ORF Transcript_53056/g.154388 Transcript_53056/m.154388 type:complete len:201 (-) Transcript_53056:824-1426(-)
MRPGTTLMSWQSTPKVGAAAMGSTFKTQRCADDSQVLTEPPSAGTGTGTAGWPGRLRCTSGLSPARSPGKAMHVPKTGNLGPSAPCRMPVPRPVASTNQFLAATTTRRLGCRVRPRITGVPHQSSSRGTRLAAVEGATMGTGADQVVSLPLNCSLSAMARTRSSAGNSKMGYSCCALMLKDVPMRARTEKDSASESDSSR